MNAWAQNVAEEVVFIQKRVWREWISAIDYAEHFRKSRAQANHILNRATEYGALERAPLRAVGLNPAQHRGSRFAWRRPLCTCSPVANDGRWDDPNCPEHGEEGAKTDGPGSPAHNHWNADGDLVIEEKTLFRMVGWRNSQGQFFGVGSPLVNPRGSFAPVYEQIATWVDGEGWKDL
ncbi:MAG TPA: hypothetical protein VHB02_06175 [Acidimicrobiales bacterium]|nr:hypothetical protein [Acidimicrobiales bacterium]